MTKINQAPVFTITIFLSAYLLFLIQPMVGKALLPVLGGTPSVWNTAMVFFQILLLLGYLYAHLLGKIQSIKKQISVHALILAGAFLVLPMTTQLTPPTDNSSPLLWQIVTMAGMIGLPFFVLSTSAPLLQKWFSVSGHPQAHSPYFLYSASNIGSVLALILYPVIVERFLPLPEQAIGFQIGFGILIVGILFCGGIILKNPIQLSQIPDSEEDTSPTYKTIGLWLFLAFIPSSLMLGFTSFVTTDIGSTPLFWVIPLTLYILSFVLAFAHRKLLSLQSLRIVFVLLFVIINVILNFLIDSYKWEVAIVHGILFFVTALLCHQLLESLKPSPKHLTLFFLILSIGGACGGIFNALLAPLIFVKPYEYMLVSGLACIACAIGQKQKILILVGLLLMAIHPVIPWEPNDKKLIYTSRNYFGTLSIRDTDNLRILSHGKIDHGSQALDQKFKTTPVTYYSSRTAIGESINAAKSLNTHLNAAVLGLGAGVFNCLLRPSDTLTFYEIDPDVIKVAQDKNFFTYLSDCKTKTTIIQGDGRIKIKDSPEKYFDYIIIDAFSGDNIPIHLITENAAQLYMSKLKDDGILVFHVSNRYMKLARELNLVAHDMGIPAYHKISLSGQLEDSNIPIFSSEVVIFTKNKKIADILLNKKWEKLNTDGKPYGEWHPWTDGYANPLRALFVAH